MKKIIVVAATPPRRYRDLTLGGDLRASIVMKSMNAIGLALVLGFLAPALTQAQTQTVTLTASNSVSASYACSTNQVITINSFVSSFGGSGSYAHIRFQNGLTTRLQSSEYGIAKIYPYISVPVTFNGSAVFTGVTNISVSDSSGYVGALTFTVTTPTAQSTIPANAVVIPTDATGPVQIVLESSSDLINWTSSLPGTYGSTYSNRFFRVRAIAQ